MKMFWNEIVVMTILSATELFTLKMVSSCHVNFTSIKTQKNPTTLPVSGMPELGWWGGPG